VEATARAFASIADTWSSKTESEPIRRQARFPRVGHGLRRLIVIGSDGMVSLAALRWLADQDASVVMLDRDGSVLATTGQFDRRMPSSDVLNPLLPPMELPCGSRGS
jgi:hypothetical protein